MAKLSKTEKAQPPWQAIPTEVYLREAAELVHFSAKIVNSNAEPFGVRLGRQSHLPMPYVSVRGLMNQAIELGLDYIQNPAGNKSGADNTIKKIDAIKQIKRLQSESVEAINAEGENILETKAALEAVTATGYATPDGMRRVSPRLRQILLPKGDGYVALTPLPSGGLSQKINRRMQVHNAKAKDAGLHVIYSATLGIGGSNPQNVGSLVRETQTAWAFAAPTENRAIRIALAIHYHGIAIRLPHRAMLAWKNWRIQAATQHNGQIPTDMRHREQERQRILAVADGVIRQGHKARRILERHEELFDDLLAEDCSDKVIRGLIDPTERDKTWPRVFGQRIADTIGRYKTGDALLLPLDGASLQRIARWVEEHVR